MSAKERRKGAARLCECGCGRPAPLAPHTDRRRGWLVGQPLRFVHGHNARRSMESFYEVRDGDYKTPCWIWLGGTNERGYGRYKHNGRMRPAHRVLYELRHGPVPSALQMDHLCRNPRCVNPDHLEPVTAGENTRRSGVAKLNREDVYEIRRLASIELTVRQLAGKKRRRMGFQVELAQRFGISPTTIKQIVRGDRWVE